MHQRWSRAVPIDSRRRPRRVGANRRPALIFSFAIIALSLAGCADNPVGLKCFLGAEPGSDTEVVVASPALECQSRACLHVPLAPGVALPENSEHAPLCTAECDVDDDCDRVPNSPCQNGFTCAVATVVGSFCCRKLCMCRDYLVIPEEGLVDPEACNPDNPDNQCINLPGRAEQ